MEIKNFTITKRDGSKDGFSLDKIMHAIVKAFESVNEPSDLASISKINVSSTKILRRELADYQYRTVC